jgi:hypothetical protein
MHLLKLLLLIPFLLIVGFCLVGECLKLALVLFLQIGGWIWGRDAHK